MSTLRIFCFGGLRLVRDGESQPLTLAPMARSLLAYLLLYRQRSHHRERLLEVFWPSQDENHARNCLNSTLWRVRTVLEPAEADRGAYLVTTPAGEVAFNQDSEYWLDLAAFEEGVAVGLTRSAREITPAEVEQLQAALALYAGDLLDGFYDDWVLREQERLRNLYLRTLAGLMRYHERNAQYDAAITNARQILSYDPLREDIHRALMHLFIANGQRALAVRQYEVCRQALAAEMNLEPMPETRSLYISLMEGSVQPLPNPESSASLELLSRQLSLILDSLDDVRRQIHQAVELANRHTKRNL